MTNISKRTVWLGVAGLAAVALMAAVIVLSGSERVGLVVSDIGEAAIVSASAIVIFIAARGFGEGALRRNWMLVAAGVAAFAVGDIIWAYLEVGLGSEVPYPGVPDIFYLLEYVFLGSGIVLAGLGYKGLIPVRRPALIAGIAAVAIALALWFGFISPLVVAGEWNAESVLSSIYPLADVMLLMGPAVFVALVVGQLGGGRLGWPWISVAVGAIILAASDSVYSYLSAIDIYRSGMPVDFGWMLAHVAVAIGALIAYDLAHPAGRPSAS